MGAKKSTRLGRGQFEEATRWRSQDYTRRLILDDIQRRYPDVLSALAGDPLTCYRALPSERVDLGRYEVPDGGRMFKVSLPRRWSWGEVTAKERNGSGPFGDLQRELASWAHWAVAASWFYDVALETLHWWSRLQALPDPLAWAPDDETASWHSPILSEPETFVFSFRGWPWWREDRADWSKAVGEAFNEAVAAHVAASMEQAHANGMEPTPVARPSASWHIPAFVDSQLERMSRAAIMARYGVETDALDKALRKVAEHAGLKLGMPVARVGRAAAPRTQLRRGVRTGNRSRTR